MELQNAINLIVKGINERKTSQVWADLGAGSGLFSRALSALLAPGSTIYAVDKNYKPDQEIASENAATTINWSKMISHLLLPNSTLRWHHHGQLITLCKR
jgi:hypothetical protein